MVYPLQSVTPATPDPLDNLDPTVIDFPDKVPPMEAAFKQSVDVEPDHAANVLDLSDKLAQPPEFVDTNLEVAKKAATVPPSQYFADISKAYPLTAEYLSDPKNMAVARDDIHNLTKNESLVQGYSRMERLWRTANYAGATLGADIAKLPATIYDIAAVPQNLLFRAAGHPEMEVQASDAVRNNPVANFYARQMEAWKPPPLPDYVDLAKNKDYLGAGQKVAESLVEFAPALAVSAMSAGAGVAMIGEQATSGALDRNRELGIDPGVSGLNAAYHGAFAAALMDVGVLGPFKKWGESLASVVGPDSAKKVMLGMFSAMGHSASTFGAMSGASSFANDYTDYATGVNPHALEGSLKRSADAAIGGILQGGVLGAVSATGGAIGRGANIRRTIQAQQIYDALQKNIEASKMYDRAPGLAEGLLDKQVKGTPLENINIPAEAFDTYFQSKNIDPNDLARELGVEDQLKNARESNADVSIPLSKWAGKLAKTEHYTALKNDIRFVEGESTVNEKKQIDDRMVEGIQAENAKAIAENPAIDEGRQFIYQDQRKQMEALGQLDPKVIEANAKMGADLITNLAIKNKVDPKEFYAKNPLRIIQPSAEAVSQAAAAQGGRLEQKARDLTQTPEFRQWFGESKAVDRDGSPKVVYHGSNRPFDTFQPTESKRRVSDEIVDVTSPVHFFSEDRSTAESFADDRAKIDERLRGKFAGKQDVKAVFLSAKNPLDLVQSDREIASRPLYNPDAPSPDALAILAEHIGPDAEGLGEWEDIHAALDDPSVIDRLTESGYDSVRLRESDGSISWAVFDPKQIKSIDNRGTFDPNDPNILRQGNLNQDIPVVQPVKSGEPYGLFSYNTDMNPEGEMRSMYTIYGDPEHPLIKVGLDAEGKPLPGAGNTTQPLSWFQERGIPIKGMEPRAAKEGWKPLDYPQGETLFQSAANAPPAFYSQVERTIDSKMGAKATGDQILAMLKNTPGVKQDELNWMGLDTFLKDHKGPIDKKELQDFVRANKVEIHEVTKSQGYGTEPEGMSVDQMKNAIADAEDAPGSMPEHLDDTKFSNYTLPGGTNYREMLFTLPEKQNAIAEARNARVKELIARRDALQQAYESTQPGPERQETRRQLSNAETQIDMAMRESSDPNAFKSGHWDEPNVLAHVRMNDRVVYDTAPQKTWEVKEREGKNPWGVYEAGSNAHVKTFATKAEAEAFANESQPKPDRIAKRVLHIEEVQSDWHQKGRESGYQEPSKLIDGKNVDYWRNRAGDLFGKWKATGEDDPVYKQWFQAKENVKELAGSEHAVPDAPFKKSWHEFALKRMLRYAAENGYDKITWPTGEQQAERYSLQRQLNSVSWEKEGDKIFVSMEAKDGRAAGAGTFAVKDLPDVVGKEMAQKISDSVDAGETKAKYEGLDLKVGGEGMKGFYDKIIPEFLNKYTKKWGGRVGETDLPVGLGEAGLREANRRQQQSNVFENIDPTDVVQSTAKVHSLDITPAMKDSVMQGQTLFQSAWHGSPHDFEQFSLQKIGTGEGAQSYGWGLYFAGRKDVAEHYKEVLSPRRFLINDKTLSVESPIGHLMVDVMYGKRDRGEKLPPTKIGKEDVQKAIAETERRYESYRDFDKQAQIDYLKTLVGKTFSERRDGRLYEVEIPDDPEYLDLDKPIAKQSAKVQETLAQIKTNAGAAWVENYRNAKRNLSGKSDSDITGKDLYRFLANEATDDLVQREGFLWNFIKDNPHRLRMSGAEVASRYLSSLGLPGLRFLDQESRYNPPTFIEDRETKVKELRDQYTKNPTAELADKLKDAEDDFRSAQRAESDKTFNYVVFDDSLVKVLDKLYQENPDPESNPRAFLQSTSHESILAMIKPDESTYPHEMAHYWLKGFHSFIESGLGEEKHLADWKILSDWLKIEEGQKGITRDQQEQFAKGFEVYVMEGKAPRAELAPVFAKFRKWISAVYRHLFPYTPEEQQMIREGWLISKHPSLDVRVSPAMRGFMDRMLASEDEIAFAQKDVSLDPGAEMHIEGLDAKVQARLEKLRGEAHEDAVHRLTVLQMKEMGAEHQAKMTDEALKARVQAEDVVRNSPAQTAMRAIERSFGKDPLKTSQDYWLNKMGADDRAQYELMAEVRGFTSGDEMAQKVIAEQPVETQIQAMVDAHMAQFPALRETINIKEEAQKAVHNERSTEVMALERAILQTKANEAQGRRVDQMRRAEEAKIEAMAARKRAQELIAAKPISAAGKFLPYFTAERNAAMRVQKALASKDYAAAAEAKRQQMLNHALASEAFKVRQGIERWNDYVHDVEKKDKALFKQEEHFNQVAAILDRFGMTREDYDPATKTESFASWGERMILQDEAVSIAPWLFDETVRKPFGSLTVDEAHDVVNALKNIQRIANAQQNFYRLMDGASVMNTVVDLTNEAALYNKPQEAEGIMRRQNTVLERTKKWIRGYDSTLRTIENVALKLGGWKDSSLWLKVLWDPVERAADAESNLMKPLNEGYEKLLTDHFSPKERRALVDYSEAKFIPELKQSVRRIDLLMMALNTGNEGNRARLFQTPIVGVGPDVPWGEQPVMEMLQKHLTAKDWKFVNGTWKLIHSLWPKEVDIHKEITGFTPGRVDPLPFSVTTPEGEVVQMDGGYFPLKADNRANLQTEIREQVDDPLYTERNPAWKATTKTGHLQGRIEGAKYPVALDSSIIQRHLRDAVHDIAFRATVIDLRRLIGNQQFANTVKNYAGEEQYKALRDWVGSVASGNAREKAALSYWENVSKAMRAKYSAAVLMFNPKIVTQNLSNAFLFAGAVEGYDWGDATHAFINKGILDFIPSSLVKAKRAEEFRQRIYEKSTFMRDKANSPEYSIQQTFDKLTGKSHKMSDFFYGYFSAADELTTLPNWQVAYEKKVSQGAAEADAVAYADTLIRRSVGAARKYETAPIFRGTEMDKTLATFQGFMNAQQNRWERERGIWGQNYIKNSPRFAGYVAAHFGLFAAASNILSGNLPSFTDEDQMKKWMKSLLLYKFQMMPGVNAISSVVADEFLHLPSFGYRPVPQTAIIEKALDALKVGIAYGEGRGEGKDVLETATHTGAFLSGQPDQFLKLLWNAYDIAFEGMTPQFNDLLSRRPKKERQ